ncbi:unnamed protein product, partial [Effrenium voratum]
AGRERTCALISLLPMSHESPSADQVEYCYVTKEIGVPVCVLTEKDCDTRWQGFPQWLPFNGRRIEFQVPQISTDAGSNIMLQVPVPDGKLEVPLPERCAEGDTLCLFQRTDDSWKIVRRRDEFSFVVPDCSPGDSLTLTLAEQVSLSFAVPEGVSEHDVVTLRRQPDGEWAFDRCAALPPFTPTPFQPEWTTAQYQHILDALKDKGYIDRLPRNLNVSVPFCGHFHEYVALGNFLSENFPSDVSVFGMELYDDYLVDWAKAQRWLKKVRGIRCCIEAGDLAQDPLPSADLAIGIHPEVTKGGPWFRIIGSLLRCCKLCVFATFYKEEKETLVNMINMYQANGSVEVFENPFYETRELPSHPAMRFVVVVEQPAGEKELLRSFFSFCSA